MCDISQNNVCLSLDSRVTKVRDTILFGSLFQLCNLEHWPRHRYSIHISLDETMTKGKKCIHCLPPNTSGPPLRAPCSNGHWLPDSTGTVPFKKVIGLLAEAVLLLTAVERARQRKDNKGKKTQRENDETNSVLCSLETRA